jgi:type II secretory pathway pseudopilin PulG
MKNQIIPAQFSFCPGMSARAITLLEVLVIVVIVVVLLGITPVFHTHSHGHGQTKQLAQAKQIGLALILYAGDHEGRFPAGVNQYGETIRTSNDAFRDLFPTYTQSETIFTNKLSVWGPSADNIIQPISEILRAGENAYAYVSGLDKNSNSASPLVVDGTDGTGTGHYVSDNAKHGGVWGGRKAIVICLDNSAALENLTGPPNARYVKVKEQPSDNLLNVTANLGSNVKLLDPAIVPPGARSR